MSNLYLQPEKYNQTSGFQFLSNCVFVANLFKCFTIAWCTSKAQDFKWLLCVDNNCWQHSLYFHGQKIPIQLTDFLIKFNEFRFYSLANLTCRKKHDYGPKSVYKRYQNDDGVYFTGRLRFKDHQIRINVSTENFTKELYT